MGHQCYYVVGPKTELVSIWKTIKKEEKVMEKEYGFACFHVASDMLTFHQNMPLRYECFDKKGHVTKENIAKGTTAIVAEGDRIALAEFLQYIINHGSVSDDVFVTTMEGINYKLYLDDFHVFRKQHPNDTFENEYIQINPRLFHVI